MYGKGNLHWYWDPPDSTYKRGVSIIVYHPEGGRREPKWFKTNQWYDFEVYAFRKVGDYVNTQTMEYQRKAYDQDNIQVLLYNEKDQEAYFIISNQR